MWRAAGYFIHGQQTHHNGGVPAGADGRGRQRVEGGTSVELLGAEVVGAVTQTAADGAALVPAARDRKMDVSSRWRDSENTQFGRSGAQVCKSVTAVIFGIQREWSR